MENLNACDYDKNYLELLGQLTTVGKVYREQFENFVEKNGHQVFVFKDDHNKNVIGTITLIVEEKLIHGCGKVLHVEDVVVDESMRGKGIGKKMLDFALQYAKNNNCYKIILDCSESVKQFYESVGYTHKNLQMSYYI